MVKPQKMIEMELELYHFNFKYYALLYYVFWLCFDCAMLFDRFLISLVSHISNFYNHSLTHFFSQTTL